MKTRKDKSLTEAQTEVIEAILALPEQGKRSMAYGMTILNKQRRGVAAAFRRYRVWASEIGFTELQVAEQIEDIKDMIRLEAASL
jgi:hypothetical protein